MSWLKVIGALLAVGAIASLWGLARLAAPIELPPLTGPYPISKQQWVMQSPRPDPHDPNPFAKREFLVNVYYPTLITPDNVDVLQPAPYTSPAMARALAELQTDSTPARFLLARLFSEAHSQARRGWRSGLSPVTPKYPVVVFSPGRGWFADMHSFFLEQLASFGYVVFAITHPGHTPLVEYPDGRRATWGWSSSDAVPLTAAAAEERDRHYAALDAALENRNGLAVGSSEAALREFNALQKKFPRTLALSVRKDDVLDLLDRLEQLNAGEPAGMFAGRLDLEHLAVMGMSYGGATASEVCLDDPRCKAVINMDGGEAGRLPFTSNTLPALWFYSRDADEAKNARRRMAYERYAGPAWLVYLDHADHGTFADFPWYPPDLTWSNVLLASVFIDGREGRRAAQRHALSCVLDFVDHYLKGKTLQFLNGAHPLPGAAIHSRNTTRATPSRTP